MKLFYMMATFFISLTLYASECPLDYSFDMASGFSSNQKLLKILKNDPARNTPACLSRALHYSVEAGNFQSTKLLIESGANINSIDNRFKVTPTIQAIIQRDAEMLKLLLNYAPDLRGLSSRGKQVYPALYYSAVKFNNLEATKLLLNAGADPNEVVFSDRDSNLLNEAIWNLNSPFKDQKKTLKIVELLLESGADPYATAKLLNGKVMSMFETAKELERRTGHSGAVKLLIKYGASE